MDGQAFESFGKALEGIGRWPPWMLLIILAAGGCIGSIITWLIMR